MPVATATQTQLNGSLGKLKLSGDAAPAKPIDNAVLVDPFNYVVGVACA